MLVIRENECCPHSSRCPYNRNQTCAGAFPRSAVFNCTYVSNDGVFNEMGQIRNPMDKTGNMKVIME